MFLKLLKKLGRKKVVLDRGPSHPKFSEAKQMIELGGMFSIKNDQEFKDRVDYLSENKLAANEIGLINSNFVLYNKGATN